MPEKKPITASEMGKRSPTKFDSKRASEASKRRWAKYHAEKAKQDARPS
jgi:hypothetical protein